MQVFIFMLGLIIVIFTFSSAISRLVLREARSQLNQVVFGLLRRVINFIPLFAKSYSRRDSVMAPQAS
jgi:hypothetical protein